MERTGLIGMSMDQYHAFLSHNSADKPFVESVAEALERSQLRPWLDKWHLTPGEPWQPAIEQALRDCQCCVVFVGPSGLGAWQHEEMRQAIDRRVNSSRAGQMFRVIPVLLPGAVRGYRSDLPEFLTATTWVEFRSADDPLALRTLERAIRGLAPRDETKAPADVACPYRGLGVFDVQDAEFFFGREAVTDWLLSVLRGTQSTRGPSRFLAIVGASGSGKSSLARAGVLAALKQGEIDGSQEWLVTICKPGPRPLESLAGALTANPRIKLGEGLATNLSRDLIQSLSSHANELHLTTEKNLPAGAGHARHVVLIDQFEEVFSQCQDVVERTAFIDNLLHAGRVSGGRTTVLLTMRADFYPECARHGALRTVISDNSFLLGPLNDEELRSAIERPTLMCGRTVEPGLTALLIQDMADQEQALPLLQHALRHLWESATKPELRLTVEAYTTSGRLQGALNKHANAVFDRLTSDERAICRELMLALVNRGDAVRETRRRVPIADLIAQVESPGDAKSVVQALAGEQARLVVTSGTASSETPSSGESELATVELIHESMVQGWSKLRGWLDEARLEEATPRGRARKRLIDLADAFAQEPNARHLPSLVEYFAIRRHTRARNWTGSQRRLMGRATRYFGTRGLLLAAVLLAAAWGGREWNGRTQARALVDSLMVAGPDEIRSQVAKLAPYRRWADRLLEQRLAETEERDGERRLRLRLALVPVREHQVAPLVEQMLQTNEPRVFGAIRESLAESRALHAPQWADAYWQRLHDAQAESTSRFFAGVALARFVPPDDAAWTDDDWRLVVTELLRANPEHQGRWRELLRPLRERLFPAAEAAFTDSTKPESEQLAAANLVADYWKDDAARLARLIASATAAQHKILYPLVAAAEHHFVCETLHSVASEQPSAELTEAARIRLGKRRAGAALTLLRLGERESSFEALRVHDDPESLTQFVHRSREWSVTPPMLLDCIGRADADRQKFSHEQQKLERTIADRVLFGLLLAMGEYSSSDLPTDEQQKFVAQLADWYAHDPSSAIHGATGWLLRHFGQDSEARKVDETPIDYEPGREWYTLKIEVAGSGVLGVLKQPQRLYLTFVVFEPGEYAIGSPETEADREKDEAPHSLRLAQPVAILDREITRAEYEAFDSKFKGIKAIESVSKSTAHAMVGPSWYDAVRFCRAMTTLHGLSESDQPYEDERTVLKQGDYLASAIPGTDGAPKNWPLRIDRLGFRLPLEAEWELACRSGMQTRYSFGSDATRLPAYGWFEENSRRQAHVTRQQRPNLRGLFDLHGNVFEWCHDSYDADRARDATPKEGSIRVYRGGNWGSTARSCRSANRDGISPDHRDANLGFRVAVSPAGLESSVSPNSRPRAAAPRP